MEFHSSTCIRVAPSHFIIRDKNGPDLLLGDLGFRAFGPNMGHHTPLLTKWKMKSLEDVTIFDASDISDKP